MARRTRRISKRAYKATKRIWRKKTKHGRFKGMKVHVKRRAGFRKKIRGMRGTGRKGTVSIFSRLGRFLGTNPRRRRNPAIVAQAKELIVTPVTGLPKEIPGLFKGKVVMNVAFATGGAVVGLAGGSMVQRLVLPLLAQAPVVGSYVSNAMGKAIVQRIVGASFALLTGSVVAKVALKDKSKQTSFVTGVAAAALVEAIFPGRFAALVAKVPVVGSMMAPVASPVQGIAGLFGTDDLAGIGAYVESPAYQGTNGLNAYVESPAYQGTNGLNAYVESPAYQGTNGLGANDAVAGMGYAGEALAGMGSNMPSHLDS